MNTNNEAGFSLLEISIVLIILGIMGSLLLPGWMAQHQNQKNHLTRTHQERVFHALAVYVQLYGRLPCPADPAQKGEQRGMARARCADAASAQGWVPFRTLGLSETYAKDGGRHFFTYAVHPGLTSLKLLKFCGQTLGKELFVQEEGGVVQGQGEQDHVAIVLVSHGAAEGKVSACQQENRNGDLVFCARPPKDQGGSFKDLVRWETRFNFGTYYAKINCIEKR